MDSIETLERRGFAVKPIMDGVYETGFYEIRNTSTRGLVVASASRKDLDLLATGAVYTASQKSNTGAEWRKRGCREKVNHGGLMAGVPEVNVNG